MRGILQFHFKEGRDFWGRLGNVVELLEIASTQGRVPLWVRWVWNDGGMRYTWTYTLETGECLKEKQSY